VPVDSRDVVPEEVANPQHTPHPNDGAEHVVPYELAEFHPAHARDHGRKRPYNGDELRDHDCRPPIFCLKFVGPDSMLLVEEEAVFPIENPRTCGAADEMPERVAQNCRKSENWSKLIYIQVSVRGEQAGGNKQGITG
jgi:hypothetical protein